MPIFDDYAEIAFDVTTAIVGEPVSIVASDGRFPTTEAEAVIMTRHRELDADGFEVVSQGIAVRIDVRKFEADTGYKPIIDDQVEIEDDDGITRYRIISEIKDVNLTTKFFLQVLEI